METLRFQVVGEAFKKKPVSTVFQLLDVKAPSERSCEYSGRVAGDYRQGVLY